jgi:hypothetical protein
LHLHLLEDLVLRVGFWQRVYSLRSKTTVIQYL